MLPHDHSIWVLLFEQTPPALRWVLMILTGGIFWLIQRLYLNHKERVNRLENLIISQGVETNNNIKHVHEKVDKLTLSILNKRG